MANKLKISVVTVCYNAVDTIEETILSVINQSYDNIEYIIIDGGSTDGTVDIIRKYAADGSETLNHRHRITYWVSEPDRGIYDAMNKGIAAATGDYTYFIGADDTLFNANVFSNVSEAIGSDRSAIFYGDVILFPEKKIYSGKFSMLTLVRKNICHQAIFYPTNILKENPYKLKYKAYSDYYENILLWGKGTVFKYIHMIICNFFVGGFSINGDTEFMNNRGNIIYRYLGLYAYLYYLIRIVTVNHIKKFYGNC